MQKVNGGMREAAVAKYTARINAKKIAGPVINSERAQELLNDLTSRINAGNNTEAGFRQILRELHASNAGTWQLLLKSYNLATVRDGNSGVELAAGKVLALQQHLKRCADEPVSSMYFASYSQKNATGNQPETYLQRMVAADAQPAVGASWNLSAAPQLLQKLNAYIQAQQNKYDSQSKLLTHKDYNQILKQLHKNQEFAPILQAYALKTVNFCGDRFATGKILALQARLAKFAKIPAQHICTDLQDAAGNNMAFYQLKLADDDSNLFYESEGSNSRVPGTKLPHEGVTSMKVKKPLLADLVHEHYDDNVSVSSSAIDETAAKLTNAKFLDVFKIEFGDAVFTQFMGDALDKDKLELLARFKNLKNMQISCALGGGLWAMPDYANFSQWFQAEYAHDINIYSQLIRKSQENVLADKKAYADLPEYYPERSDGKTSSAEVLRLRNDVNDVKSEIQLREEEYSVVSLGSMLGDEELK